MFRLKWRKTISPLQSNHQITVRYVRRKLKSCHVSAYGAVSAAELRIKLDNDRGERRHRCSFVSCCGSGCSYIVYTAPRAFFVRLPSSARVVSTPRYGGSGKGNGRSGQGRAQFRGGSKILPPPPPHPARPLPHRRRYMFIMGDRQCFVYSIIAGSV